MSRTKRIIAALLVLCMVLCFGLTACSIDGTDSSAAVPEGSAAFCETVEAFPKGPEPGAAEEAGSFWLPEVLLERS